MTGAEVVAKAMEYVGTPVVHQARVKGVGVDCVGLLVCVGQELGLQSRSNPAGVQRLSYPREPDGTLLDACLEHMHAIDLDEAKPGDALLAGFRFEGYMPRHLGILTERGARCYWVHAEGYRYKRVTHSRLMFDGLGMRVLRAFRMPGVE